MRLVSFVVLILCLSSSALAIDVSFFEEFPSVENFAQLDYIDFPTKVYVAAHNTSEFTYWEEYLTRNFETVEEVIYWPLLPKEAGYWVSPWADSTALDSLFASLSEGSSVMLDLEFPLERENIVVNLDEATSNKQRIEQFLLDAPLRNITVYAIEITQLPYSALELMGLWYDDSVYDITRIRMYYSSFRRHYLPDFLVDRFFVRQAALAAREDIVLGIGLITTGIHGDEPIYDTKTLTREIRIAHSLGVKEVVIFRAGGLTDEMVEDLNSVTSTINSLN